MDECHLSYLVLKLTSGAINHGYKSKTMQIMQAGKKIYCLEQERLSSCEYILSNKPIKPFSSFNIANMVPKKFEVIQYGSLDLKVVRTSRMR